MKKNTLLLTIFTINSFLIVAPAIHAMAPYSFTETVGRMLSPDKQDSETPAQQKKAKSKTATASESTIGPVESALVILIQFWSKIPQQTKDTIEMVLKNALQKGFSSPEVQAQMQQVLIGLLRSPEFNTALVGEFKKIGVSSGSEVTDKAIATIAIDQIITQLLQKSP